MKETPDDKVATRIVTEIKKEKLLSPGKLGALTKKLAAGGLGEQDWNLLSEGDGV